MSYSDYSGALTLGRMHRLLARLLRRDERLVMLDEASQCSLVYVQTWPYTQDVPVEQITGTVDRPCDFASHFRPSKAHPRTRWMRVNEAIEAGANLPPVKLYKFGD